MAGVWQTGATWPAAGRGQRPARSCLLGGAILAVVLARLPGNPTDLSSGLATGRASPGDRNAHSTSSTGRSASDRRLPSVRKSPSAAVTTWVELLPEREAKARTLAGDQGLCRRPVRAGDGNRTVELSPALSPCTVACTAELSRT